jgi:hypothetical protein
MPKTFFFTDVQNTKYQNKYISDIYVYSVQFADGPMSRAHGEVYRITHLSPPALL